MNFEFREDSRLEEGLKALKKLAGVTVEIGIPPEKDAHSGPFSASGLLALQEAGSPINRIPPRPVLRPALEDAEVKEEITDSLYRALEQAMEGNEAGMREALEEAGEAGAEALRAYVTSGANLAPNAAITVYGGWMRNRSSGKAVLIEGKGSSIPLIDTGQLVDSFGYRVKEG